MRRSLEIGVVSAGVLVLVGVCDGMRRLAGGRGGDICTHQATRQTVVVLLLVFEDGGEFGFGFEVAEAGV